MFLHENKLKPQCTELEGLRPDQKGPLYSTSGRSWVIFPGGMKIIKEVPTAEGKNPIHWTPESLG